MVIGGAGSVLQNKRMQSGKGQAFALPLMRGVMIFLKSSWGT